MSNSGKLGRDHGVAPPTEFCVSSTLHPFGNPRLHNAFLTGSDKTSRGDLRGQPKVACAERRLQYFMS